MPLLRRWQCWVKKEIIHFYDLSTASACCCCCTTHTKSQTNTPFSSPSVFQFSTRSLLNHSQAWLVATPPWFDRSSSQFDILKGQTSSLQLCPFFSSFFYYVAKSFHPSNYHSMLSLYYSTIHFFYCTILMVRIL